MTLCASASIKPLQRRLGFRSRRSGIGRVRISREPTVGGNSGRPIGRACLPRSTPVKTIRAGSESQARPSVGGDRLRHPLAMRTGRPLAVFSFLSLPITLSCRKKCMQKADPLQGGVGRQDKQRREVRFSLRRMVRLSTESLFSSHPTQAIPEREKGGRLHWAPALFAWC